VLTEGVGSRSKAGVVALACTLAAAAVLASAPVASANDLFTLDPDASSPGRVIEDAAGTAYIGWNHDAAIDQPMFCRIPAGGTCTSPISLPIPGATSISDEVDNVFPVFGGGKVLYLVAPRYAHNDVILWTSANGGQSFDAGGIREGGYSGKTESTTVLLSGFNFLISGHNVGLGFGRTTILALTGKNFSFASPGASSIGGSTMGFAAPGIPLEAYWLLSEPLYQVRYYRYDGSGAIDEEANWTGPETVGSGYEPRLAGGPSGLFLVSQDYGGGQSPSVLSLRKYASPGFAPPVTLANDPPLGLFEGGAIAQSPGGRLAVAWPVLRAADGAPLMRLFTSIDGGANFSTTDIAHIGGYAINDNAQLAVGDGGQGWLTFRDGSALRVADLNPIAGPPPSPGPVPPTYKGPTKTITKSVDGFLLTLTVPKRCLQPQQPFFIGVGKRARRKVKKTVRGKLKIVKVTFKFDGKKLSTKKKKPFRQLVTPGPLASGSKHTVATRVTARLTKRGHSKKVVRVLRGTISIC
jgi:hypothetical protein